MSNAAGGFEGGAVSSPTGLGQSPGGGRGARPPEARDFTLQLHKN